MSEALTVGPAVSKELARIMATLDDPRALDDAEDFPDFLPYEFPFQILAELVGVEAKEAGESNEGIFVTLKVHESNNAEVLVNKTYTLTFWVKNKDLHDLVMRNSVKSRKAFAAVLARKPNDDDFRPMPVFLKLHQATAANPAQSLGIMLRIENKYIKTTKRDKRIHELTFALA
jgi:hypothetical protein